MKSKGLLIVVFAALTILGSTLFIVPVKASGPVDLWRGGFPSGYLYSSYPSIKLAVYDAWPNDDILVYSGTYYEHVTITTSNIKIMEAPLQTAILDGLPSGGPQLPCAFEINGASNVLIQGFTIQNYWAAGVWTHKNWGTGTPASANTVAHNIIWNNYEGILVSDSGYNTFEDNDVHDNTGIGVFVDAGYYTHITKNDIYRNTCGGIVLHIAAYSEVTKNPHITENIGGGISADGYSGGLLIEKNDDISRNGWMGIYVISGGNTIRQNTVSDNAVDGIRLEQGGGNLIEKNTVKKNGNYGIVMGTYYFWLATGIDAPASYSMIKQNTVSGSSSGYDLVDDIHAINNIWLMNSGMSWTTHLA